MVSISGEARIGMIHFSIFSLVHQRILPLGPFPSWDEFLSPDVGSFFEPIAISLMS